MPERMSGKERMLCALGMGVPDRVPATIHQWLPYHLKYCMGGINDIDAFKHVGLDIASGGGIQEGHTNPQWVIDEELISEQPDEKVCKYTITTPDGKLWYTKGFNEQTAWIIDRMIKEHEDVHLIRKYMPVPMLVRESVTEASRRIGRDGILRGGLFGEQAGPWQAACCLAGTEQMIMECFDNPDWVHELLGILTDKRIRYIEENLPGTEYDLIETGGGAASSTVISPQLFADFCLPYDRRIHEALHAAGMKITYHTCGGMMPILDLIVANGCDASETLSPKSVGGDVIISEVKKQIGEKVCLIGGLNQFQVLTEGTPEMVKAEVHRLFREAGARGGYIISTCDHFFNTPVENIKAYAEAAKECVYTNVQ